MVMSSPKGKAAVVKGGVARKPLAKGNSSTIKKKSAAPGALVKAATAAAVAGVPRGKSAAAPKAFSGKKGAAKGVPKVPAVPRTPPSKNTVSRPPTTPQARKVGLKRKLPPSSPPSKPAARDVKAANPRFRGSPKEASDDEDEDEDEDENENEDEEVGEVEGESESESESESEGEQKASHLEVDSESEGEEDASDLEVDSNPEVESEGEPAGASASEDEVEAQSEEEEGRSDNESAAAHEVSDSADSEEDVDDAEPSSLDDSGSLENFALSAPTKAALDERGVSKLFPIQIACFAKILAGNDLIGRAHTGMGKTLAFALPTIERIYQLRGGSSNRIRADSMRPRALVLCPTRELAQQVAREFESVAASLSVLCVYGGAPIGGQISALRAGVDVLVGTPGRLKDHHERQTVQFDSVRLVTLDEADQMLEMGFEDELKLVLGACSHPERQTCLFSATLPPFVREVAPKYMRNDPELVDLVGDGPGQKASSDVRHIVISAPGPTQMRASTINDVIAMYGGTGGRVIAFCGTKVECDELSSAAELRYEAKVLHGDIPQALREKTMASFRQGRFRVLVATDVAARGLDMSVELVVQVRPPTKGRSTHVDVETYVHRSGRTGRAGRNGICVTLVGPRDRQQIEAIERQTQNNFEWLARPSPKGLLKTAAETAATDAAATPEAVLPYFEEAAKQLLDAKGGEPLQALCAALAIATGTEKVPAERSMMTNMEGYVTLHATFRSQVTSPSFIWGALRKVLPSGTTDGVDNVRSMRLTADGYGGVFDISEELMPKLQKEIERGDWLQICANLPELSRGMGADGKGGRGGGKGGRGGGRGGGKGGGYGGGYGGKGGKGGMGGGKGGKGGGFGGKGGGFGGKGGGFGGGKGGDTWGNGGGKGGEFGGAKGGNDWGKGGGKGGRGGGKGGRGGGGGGGGEWPRQGKDWGDKIW